MAPGGEMTDAPQLKAVAPRSHKRRSQKMLSRAWIPVTDSQPDIGEHCLVWNGHLIWFASLSSRSSQVEWLDLDGKLIREVSHWMPLPGAPVEAVRKKCVQCGALFIPADCRQTLCDEACKKAKWRSSKEAKGAK